MAKLEVFQKSDSLFHAYISINFKAYVSDWIARVEIPNDILGHHIQSRGLLTNEWIFSHRRENSCIKQINHKTSDG